MLFSKVEAVRFRKDGFSTHQPVLYSVVKATSGPIIEFGCGNGSTDLLHELCQSQGRVLISLDDNMGWQDKYRKKYKGRGYEKNNKGWHKLYFVPGKDLEKKESAKHWEVFLDNFELLDDITFDVCFIDQSPWLGRVVTLNLMKERARFVIIHDVDYFAVHGIFGKVKKPTGNRIPGEFDFSDVFKKYMVYFPEGRWPGRTGPPTLLGTNFEEEFPEIVSQ